MSKKSFVLKAVQSATLCLLMLNLTCAQAQDIQPISSLKSYWKTKDFQLLGEQLRSETAQSSSDNAKIIIFRAKSADAALAAPQSFFINGDYQASLVPGGYTVQDTCVGINKISVATKNADHAKPITVSNLNAQAKQVYFFESVALGNGQIALYPRKISELGEVGLLQIQTISRYTDKPCSAPPLEKVVLDGNGFFAFDKSGMDDLQQAGRVKLATLVQHMNTDFERIDSIHIDGYTDRFGTVAYNERLSLARANTVRNYFQTHGITAEIVTKGWGPANPIVVCPGDRGKEVIECLYPNRRIEVSIQGLKKSPTK